jgi:hypothetical protein
MADSLNITNLSCIMSRAWQLARFNRRTATSSLKDGFGRWLSAAWAEARDGNTAFWPVNFSRRDALQAEIKPWSKRSLERF